MKKTLLLLSIGSVSILSADQYYQSYPQPGYGQPMQGDGYYQGQYYQPAQPRYYNPQNPNQPYQQGRQIQPSYQSPAGNINVQVQQDGTNSDQSIARKVHDTISSGWFSKGYDNVSFDVIGGVVTLRGNVETNEDKAKIEENVKDINGVKQVNNQIQVTGKKSDTRPNQGYDNRGPSGYDNRGTQGYMDSNQGWRANQNATDNQGWGRSNTNATDNQGWGRTNQPADQNWRNPSAMDNQNMRNQAPAAGQDYAATENDRQINSKIRDNLGGGWFGPDFSLVIIRTTNGVVTLLGSVDKPEDAQKAQDAAKKIEGVRSVNNQLNIKNKQ